MSISLEQSPCYFPLPREECTAVLMRLSRNGLQDLHEENAPTIVLNYNSNQSIL
ncbi:hypothetical protein [Kaistella antarctica]|uniref:hypothetical protein n=1 Tax=Kaistella antarctica TaxID=266748 RepID=UPI000AAD9B96|nr:hypothetical protein [Kaistella antarctica]